jgi:formate--tetrahydrofolate ligase
VRAEVSNAWALGGAGAEDVARAVLEVMQPAGASTFQHLYDSSLPLAAKLETIAKRMYGADGITLAPACVNKLAKYESLGYGHLPVCVAKTQNSLSDDAKRLGRPSGFTVLFRDAKLSAGAGFVVAYAGDIMTMPGLPAEPSAMKIDINEDGHVVGLF